MAKFAKTLIQGSPFEITGDAYFNTRMRRKVRIACFVAAVVLILGCIGVIWWLDTPWIATAVGGIVAGAGVIAFGIGIDRNDFTRYSFLLGGSSAIWSCGKAFGQFKGWL